MVNVILKLPDDLSWIINNKEGLKWVEAAVINRLTDIKIGNLLAEKSELQDEDVDEIDHITKRSLYNMIRAE
ncbi:MAG: hypothetical protein MPEBLZ_01111 [Candidatus Methanoperedens nitroreducens]|uniref:Uncharacterized protein n=1 Tax=Candidatus Methanoperedens nitratireducens TaxID=1392998 RepID=A0A0P7ZHB2_9EURY|nr:hypothetical protein [Candidatus Methanoperedens sp. BLZ2]KAB2948384.1 MAG: hypothetical protein F9K14_00695 [Candidatus Methanoperedens sp.]KPQ44355.1 MAG: hypothetical protein MPEBLZ_01111 [Candidatus Methanoperedens sp. BLZ1]MBZ0174530.1 hypothetical protein [Candidatus Methanoperedens nitroreducens]MCX9078555.1 hypothetical protein [Candidatus Methanoperedens sp.]